MKLATLPSQERLAIAAEGVSDLDNQLKSLDALNGILCEGTPPDLSGINDTDLMYTAFALLGSTAHNPLPSTHALHAGNFMDVGVDEGLDASQYKTITVEEYSKKDRKQVEEDIYTVLQARGFQFSAESAAHLKVSRGQQLFARIDDNVFRAVDDVEKESAHASAEEKVELQEKLRALESQKDAIARHQNSVMSAYDQEYINATLQLLNAPADPLLGFTRQERFENAVAIAAHNPNCTLDLSNTDISGIDVKRVDFSGVNLVVLPEQLLTVNNLDKAENLNQRLLDKVKGAKVLQLLREEKPVSETDLKNADFTNLNFSDVNFSLEPKHLLYVKGLDKAIGIHPSIVRDALEYRKEHMVKDLDSATSELRKHIEFIHHLQELPKLECHGEAPDLSGISNETLQALTHPLLVDGTINLLERGPLSSSALLEKKQDVFSSRSRKELSADLMEVLKARNYQLPEEVVYMAMASKLQGIIPAVERASFMPLTQISELGDGFNAADKMDIQERGREIKKLVAEGKDTVEALQAEFDQKLVNALLTDLNTPADPGLGLTPKKRLETAIDFAKHNPDRDGTETDQSPLTLDLSTIDTSKVDFSRLDFTGCNVTIVPENLVGTKHLNSVKGLDQGIIDQAKALQPARKEPEHHAHAPETKRHWILRALSWVSKKISNLIHWHKQEPHLPAEEDGHGIDKSLEKKLKHATPQQREQALELLQSSDKTEGKEESTHKEPSSKKERRTKELAELRNRLKDASSEEIEAVRNLFQKSKKGLKHATDAEVQETAKDRFTCLANRSEKQGAERG